MAKPRSDDIDSSARRTIIAGSAARRQAARRARLARGRMMLLVEVDEAAVETLVDAGFLKPQDAEDQFDREDEQARRRRIGAAVSALLDGWAGK